MPFKAFWGRVLIDLPKEDREPTLRNISKIGPFEPIIVTLLGLGLFGRMRSTDLLKSRRGDVKCF